MRYSHILHARWYIEGAWSGLTGQGSGLTGQARSQACQAGLTGWLAIGSPDVEADALFYVGGGGGGGGELGAAPTPPNQQGFEAL